MSDPKFDAIRNSLDQGYAEILRKIDTAEEAYTLAIQLLTDGRAAMESLRARVAELEDEVFELSYIKEVDDD